jgi:hypothetical protein
MKKKRRKKGAEHDTYHTLIFVQHQVVIAQIGTKYDRLHVFETMEPLLPLGSLAAGVDHLVRELANLWTTLE